MLHLLPLRLFVQAVVVIAGLAALALAFGDLIGEDRIREIAGLWLRWSSIIGLTIVALLVAAWRWVAPVQSYLFPYLGGRWKGHIEFRGLSGRETRDITLEIKHTLLGLQLLLESSESISWTLIVHPERHPHFNRCWLYYVYRNRRKEGVAGAREEYQGLAVIRLEQGSPLQLLGTYFTDSHRSGTLMVSLDTPNPWWKLWR